MGVAVSPWIVCHSHYFLSFSIFLSLFLLLRKWKENGCIITNKRKKTLFIWLAETKHFVVDHFMLEQPYNREEVCMLSKHIQQIQCSLTYVRSNPYTHKTITLIKTRLCPHVRKHTLILPSYLSVSFSSLFWAQLASLFYLSVSLSGCWALVFYTAGLSLHTALFMDSMDHYLLLSFDSLHPQNLKVTDQLYSQCLEKRIMYLFYYNTVSRIVCVFFLSFAYVLSDNDSLSVCFTLTHNKCFLKARSEKCNNIAHPDIPCDLTENIK